VALAALLIVFKAVHGPVRVCLALGLGTQVNGEEEGGPVYCVETGGVLTYRVCVSAG